MFPNSIIADIRSEAIINLPGESVAISWQAISNANNFDVKTDAGGVAAIALLNLYNIHFIS